MSISPGPWKADKNVIWSIDRRSVCLMYGSKNDPEAVANAFLIAAAPQMLEALRIAADELSKRAIDEQVNKALPIVMHAITLAERKA